MKKLAFITLLILFSLPCFSERNNRINLTLGYMLGAQQSDINNDEKHLLMLDLNTGFEYLRILDSNLIVGGSFQARAVWDTWYITIGSRRYACDITGSAVEIAPVTGISWGKGNNFQFLVYPVMFDFINFTSTSVENIYSSDRAKTSIDESCTEYKTGFRLNFQWGSRLVRNGFYFGTNFVWKTTGWLKDSFGFEFISGYKLTFGF